MNKSIYGFIIIVIGFSIIVSVIIINGEKHLSEQKSKYTEYYEIEKKYRIDCDEGMHTGNECLIIGMLDEILERMEKDG